MTGACVRERERDFCVAIVTFTNLSSGFRPSMPHSHSAALPAILSIPPLLQVAPCIWTPPSHCLFFPLWRFSIYLFFLSTDSWVEQAVAAARNSGSWNIVTPRRDAPNRLLKSNQRVITIGIKEETGKRKMLLVHNTEFFTKTDI